jgi:transcription-repair coupling factor (superfamily II helicase)
MSERAALECLPAMLATDPVLAELLSGGDGVVGVSEPVRPLVAAAVAGHLSPGIVLVATATAVEAERLAHDLRAFVAPGSVELFPAWETLPFERVSPGIETMGRRLRVLAELLAARPDPSSARVVVAPIKALLQRLGPIETAARPILLERGAECRREELIARLAAAGYRAEYQVEHHGEFSVRGGIVDVGPAIEEHGIRIDLFGDEIDRLTAFDLGDQRSVEDLEVAWIHGCRELVPSPEVRSRAAELLVEAPFAAAQFERIADGQCFDGMESFLPFLVADERLVTDLLGSRDRVLLVDPRRMRDRATELGTEEEALASTLAVTWGVGHATGLPRLHAGFERLLARCAARVGSLTSVADAGTTAVLNASGWPPVLGDAAGLARHIGQLVANRCSVVVCAEGTGSALRLSSVLESEGLEIDSGPDLRRPGVHVVVQSLDRGFIAADVGLAVLAESDVTGRRRPHRAARPRARPTEGFFDSLAPGDHVVHHIHGVARYAGMTKRTIGDAERDYLLLEYRGGDKLYLPSDQIDLITPYTGGEQPSLNRLGGGEFQRQRAKVRAAVREVAEELVVLYRSRLASPGHAFGADTPWQAELEASFPFVETPDQLRVVEEVKADMELPAPMDRLVCGDVGFGKTEIALRAAFKAVQDGYQVAVLVPTTLLAQQHFQTFSDRLAPYPIRVETLSRFLTPPEARAVATGIADGTVDVVVGTHRLLAADVRFAKLGLLVIDEEQRFGVQHKEALKTLAVGVDCLTLTASPIPRTLEMSLTGLRDLSLLQTPPEARQPILTYVGEYDERAVVEAIRRELLREGQVFFVHNRVRDIDRVARDLAGLVPEARIAVAHGQQDEGTLEQVVLDFADGRYDVLVCTTIIESGIDMPTVNTLVVDRADLLGLGQLHQLRGRVGRAGQRAYAYLFHPVDKVLSEEAYERLRTIGEHTELGSGLRIAMRDLEIRGAGNLLGRDQSGHIAAMGYDLYVRMVAEAVAELKGEPVVAPAEIKLDLPVEAYLPASYIEREDLRLEAYRRLAAVREPAPVAQLAAEWSDRYGPVPAPANALLDIARLRAACARTGVTEITGVPEKRVAVPGATRGVPAVTLRISPLALRASARVRLRRLAPGAIYKEELGQLVVNRPGGGELPGAIVSLLDELVPPEPAREAEETAAGAAGRGRGAGLA